MNNLSIQRHERIASFVDQCEEWLLSDHVANNELISSAQLLNSPEYSNSEPIYLASVVNNGTVCGCAIQALPDSLHVSNIPDEAALMLLLDRLSFGSPINWLTASEEQANKLAKIWQSQFGNSWTPKTRWLLHSVSRERLCVQAASGHLRQARNLDKQIVKEWGNRYKSEAPSPIDIPRFLLRKVDEGNLFIWDHDGARSLFAISGRTSKVARVSAVYTPIEYRGCGYARAGVAALCESLLQAGLSRCILATNEEKPEIAKIYKSIGFRTVGTRVAIALDQ